MQCRATATNNGSAAGVVRMMLVLQCCLLQNQDFRKSMIAANVWSFWQHWRNKTRSLKIKWLKERRPQDFQKPIERMLTFPLLCWNIKKCTYSVKNRNRFCPSLISSLVSRSVKHFYSAGDRAGCTFLIMMNWEVLHTIYTSFPKHRVNVKRGVRGGMSVDSTSLPPSRQVDEKWKNQQTCSRHFPPAVN